MTAPLPQGVGVLLTDLARAGMWLCLKIAPGKVYDGYYQTPGGRVEHETRRDAILRETEEETGLVLDGSKMLPIHEAEYTNPDDLLYSTTTFFYATDKVPERREPEKAGPWEFVLWSDLPNYKTLPSIADAVAQYHLSPPL